jgi:hypothetical protein
MGRVATGPEKAHLMLDRAEEIRTIADGLSQDECRSFLHNIADDLERHAKRLGYRAKHNLKRQHQQQDYLPDISLSGDGAMKVD